VRTQKRPAGNGANPADQAGGRSSASVAPDDDNRTLATGSAVYGVSLLQREKRFRRTNDQISTLDVAIVTAVATERPVTLRGVFYRVVSAGAVDKSEAGYQAVGRRLLALRRDGRVPYSAITDGSRLIYKPESWGHLDQMLEDAASSYRRALWHDQAVEVIVISEKDAISGVISPITYGWDVELAITRGYSSETFTHSIAATIIDNTAYGKTTFVYQLGDHDPSGVDAWRDFQAKVLTFAPDADVVFQRLAVTPAQIEQYALPTRPTKRTDTRSAGFEGESVEVDALPPTVLRSILQSAIEAHIDPRSLALTRSVEASERERLTAMIGGLR